ncbi:MAG: c-type cytochrome [Opitutaceae bacterium]
MSGPSNASSNKRLSTARLEQGAVSDNSITAVHRQLLREKPEPTESFSPIPIVLLFIFSGLIFVCGVYIARFSGEFQATSFSPSQGRPSAESTAAAPVDPMVLGGRLFTQNCVACHQANGQGIPNVYPPLAGSEWVSGSEDRLVRILLHGLSGPIEVEGKSFNNAMPAFGPQSGYRFNAERIAAVLTYVRGSLGNTAAPVTVEKVEEVMNAVGSRSAPWTAPELEQFQ